ncbi:MULTISPECIES: hypothetical protein [Xenorhabdus]|nr:MULTISPECIES: hypothetical protein [Xenorhabdus]
MLEILKSEGLTSNEAIAFILMRELRHLGVDIQNLDKTIESH